MKWIRMCSPLSKIAKTALIPEEVGEDCHVAYIENHARVSEIKQRQFVPRDCLFISLRYSSLMTVRYVIAQYFNYFN